ncbi:LytR C-terminal domain-containing protein [Candidatus Berkelbacteria bacterium]|nr:LytR C-terminal domain-containing protein [Candidatus Berkelbacteria bacterium]
MVIAITDELCYSKRKVGGMAKAFDLEKKHQKVEMVLHEEAVPRHGFFGKFAMFARLGISWRDVLMYIVLAAVAFGLAVFMTQWLAQRQAKQVAHQAQQTASQAVALPPVGQPSAAAADQTTTSTSTQKAAATPTVDKTSFTIRVLNGNGITGDAKKTATLLKNQGFQVGAATNANSTFQKTQVWYLTGKQTEAEAVQAALEGRAIETKEAGAAAIGKGYEVLVITGVK